MPTATDLLDEFRRDWMAALNPCANCLIEACPEEERDVLAQLLVAELEQLPSPPYSPVQYRRLEERMQPLLEEVMNHPAVVAERDQREAAWRDVPQHIKLLARAISTWRSRLWALRSRCQPAPWE